MSNSYGGPDGTCANCHRDLDPAPSCGKCEHPKVLHVLGRGGTLWCCHTYCRCPRFVKEAALAPKEGT